MVKRILPAPQMGHRCAAMFSPEPEEGTQCFPCGALVAGGIYSKAGTDGASQCRARSRICDVPNRSPMGGSARSIDPETISISRDAATRRSARSPATPIGPGPKASYGYRRCVRTLHAASATRSTHSRTHRSRLTIDIFEQLDGARRKDHGIRRQRSTNRRRSPDHHGAVIVIAPNAGLRCVDRLRARVLLEHLLRRSS